MDNWEISKKVNRIKPLLDDISPTFCLAKWLYVQIHLPHGLTQSCYHPPAHQIPLEELEQDPSALHNTKFKIAERKQMILGKKPPGCEYCWKIEELNNSKQISDRLYRSSEDWAFENYDYVTDNEYNFKVKPTYLEVNFSHACNQKCIYCSPHLSSTWYEEIEQFGEFDLLAKKETEIIHHGHNNIKYLEQQGKLPFEVRKENKIKKKDNPYVKAFWRWLPHIYDNLHHFRMTGGEPLMHKDTYKVLDYALKNKNDKLEMSITSNFSPTDNKLIDKFIDKLFVLERAKSLKHFMLFVSIDSIGKKAEYIRTGMNSNKIKSNIDKFLKLYEKPATVFVENPKDGTPERDKNGKLLWKEYIVGEDTYNDICVLSEIGDKSFIKDLPRKTKHIKIYVKDERSERERRSEKQPFKAETNKTEHYVINGDDYALLSYVTSSQHPTQKYNGYINEDELQKLEPAGFSDGTNTMPSGKIVSKGGSLHKDSNYMYGVDITYNTVGKFGYTYEFQYDFWLYSSSLSFINTFNILSVSSIKKYLKFIYNLRVKYNEFRNRQMIWFDLPLLEYPNWLSADICTKDFLQYMWDAEYFMKENSIKNTSLLIGFADFEIEKLQRTIRHIEDKVYGNNNYSVERKNFALYIDQLDKRRNTNFLKVFPEYKNFYELCSN